MGLIKCDPRAQARCPLKGQCAGTDDAYFTEGSDCDLFNHEVLSAPATNASRIRVMSDEDMAVMFAMLKADLTLLDRPVRPYSGRDVNDNMDWLKKPAELTKIAEYRPSTDAISREAIIDALHEIGGCDAEPETWSAGWDAAINAAIELVEKASAVTSGERHET